MNRWKSAAALAGAALILAGSLAACAPQEEASSQTGETSSQLALENDETATSLVVAELFVSQERTAALEEIAQKYMADFPQTQIEIVTVNSGDNAFDAVSGATVSSRAVVAGINAAHEAVATAIPLG